MRKSKLLKHVFEYGIPLKSTLTESHWVFLYSERKKKYVVCFVRNYLYTYNNILEGIAKNVWQTNLLKWETLQVRCPCVNLS